MAESEDERSELEKKNSYKCCKNKSTSVVVCVNCGDLYHRSCLKRKTGKEITGAIFVCCESATTSETSNTSEVNKEQLLIENKLLKKLISEMEDKNRLLQENKRLIEEKLENYREALKKCQQKMETPHININPLAANRGYSDVLKDANFRISQKSSGRNIQEGRGQNNGRNTEEVRQNGRNTEEVRRQNNYPLSRQENTETIDNDSILTAGTNNNTKERERNKTNSNNDKGLIENRTNSNSDNGDDFVLVNRRKPKRTSNFQGRPNRTSYRKKTQIGEGENVANIAATEKRAWLFLSRIKRDITEDNIRNYMAAELKKPADSFIVKEIPTKPQQNKCFMVGAAYQHKDEMYKPAFWPSGVGFKRFDFRLYKKMAGVTQDFGSAT